MRTQNYAIIVLSFLIQGCCMFRNQHIRPIRDGGDTNDTGNQLSILTWNIGYAGLGEESDLLTSHGKMILPPSQEAIMKNEKAIVEYLTRSKRDVYLFQEIANYRVLGRKSTILDGISTALEEYTTYYSGLIKFGALLFRIKAGNALSSRISIKRVDRVDLPLERDSMWGRIQKRHMLVAFIPENGGKQWVIINLHLSVLDRNALVRKEQLERVSDYMLMHYYDGNYVVIGGDWNLRLADTNWPHTTHEEDLFWVHDLPKSWTPQRWQWGVDTSTPTVRTDQNPYVEGENYTTIIDGFLVSPNVEIDKVQTSSMDFAYSDHNPITIWVRTKTTDQSSCYVPPAF